MPEASSVAPLVGGLPVGAFWEHLGGKVGGPPGDLVEVAMSCRELFAFFANVPLAFRFRIIAEWGEQRFPFIHGARIPLFIDFCMGIELFHAPRYYPDCLPLIY